MLPPALRPFEALPFDELPSLPRRPHGYFRSSAHTLELRSRHFGTMNVNWRETGSGPPLLLVHGLMTTSYSWRYVMEPLAERFRVIVPDLPGAGRTDKPKVRYGARDLAEWLGELMAELGIRGAAAIGKSLGGTICMQLALGDPEALGRLVVVHAPAFPEPRLMALHAALRTPGAGRALARWVRRAPERWAHAHVHYHDETLKSLEEVREYARPLAEPAGARAFVRWLTDALAPAELSRLVRGLERLEGRGFVVPLLLVYARSDPMVPPEIGERLAALLGDVPLVWLEDSSHFAHVDTPEAFLDAVLPFLDA